jgi:hypothetical protein
MFSILQGFAENPASKEAGYNSNAWTIDVARAFRSGVFLPVSRYQIRSAFD